jgi:hypothetical protein
MAQFAIMPIEDYRRACDAIREKTGGTEGITSGELEAQILSIETGTQLPVLVSPGVAANLLAGKQLIDQEGNVVDGAMPEVELAKPVVKLGGKYGNGNNSQIYVSVTQSPGYVSGGTTEAYATVPNMTQPRTVTPSLQPQTIRCNGYMMLTNILVEAIPEEIVPDWNRVTATAADVRTGKSIATTDGIVDGTMPDVPLPTLMFRVLPQNGMFEVEMFQEKQGYTIQQSSKVRMDAFRFITPEGNEKTGTLAYNGATSGNIDGLNSTSFNVPEGYTEGGEITFDDTALAARLDGIQGTTSEGTLDEKFTRSENEVQTQAELLDQIEAILNGEAEGPGGSEGGGGSGSTEPETCKVTVWAGRTNTNLLICFPNGDRPAYVPLSGSGDVRYDVTVPKNSMIFVEKQGGNPTVRGAYRCTYTLVPLRNTSYPAVLAKITEDGASLSID